MIFITRQLVRIVGIALIIFALLSIAKSGYVNFMAANFPLNIVHIAVGILAIASGKTYRYSKNFLYVFGTLFCVLGIAFIINSTLLNTFTTNSTGAILYICLGIGMLAAGSLLRPKKL